ncbi:fluoride efflux transporter CrcB [Kineococcus rubinsiae]|uniref:fluoride efflux transporter CrcB n=1 Tax=Kineococcus rubinsiae TaxID=2609562 RepID=UPI0027E4EB95|nr:fluoride efflux transporter CrcB [Kineococcus rubinsiae]
MILLLAFAGGLGAVARFVVDAELRARRPGTFPLPILLVNVLGSFLLGLLTGLVRDGADDAWRLVLGVGFCGGFTTFSTTSVDTVRLARSGHVRAAVGNAAGTLVLAVAAGGVGLLLAAAAS